MTLNAATVAAALRRLAEAEGPCYNCGVGGIHEGDSEDCQHCDGTGRIPVFRSADGKALLRKECGCREWGAKFRGEFVHTADTGSCRGLGWLSLDVGEVHLEMLLFLAINNEHESLAGGQLFHTMMTALYASSRDAKTEQDLVEAAILALDAAVEAGV